MMLLSNLVTYSSITYDVGHRAASINEPAWRLGAQEGRKKAYDGFLFVSLVERSMGSSIVETVNENQSIVHLYCKFERANGYLFSMLKLVKRARKAINAMCACCCR